MQLSMGNCSDAVWQMATEYMEENRARDDTQDAAAQKLHMFTHPKDSEGSNLPDGALFRLLLDGSDSVSAGRG
jgi:hypothetical protein